MHYILAPRFRSDLEDIADWIALDHPSRAAPALRELRAAVHQVAQHPLHYQLRPDIGDDARLAVMGHYVALFWVDDDAVRFERIVYGGRDLPAIYR